MFQDFFLSWLINGKVKLFAFINLTAVTKFSCEKSETKTHVVSSECSSLQACPQSQKWGPVWRERPLPFFSDAETCERVLSNPIRDTSKCQGIDLF